MLFVCSPFSLFHRLFRADEIVESSVVYYTYNQEIRADSVNKLIIKISYFKCRIFCFFSFLFFFCKFVLHSRKERKKNQKRTYSIYDNASLFLIVVVVVVVAVCLKVCSTIFIFFKVDRKSEKKINVKKRMQKIFLFHYYNAN